MYYYCLPVVILIYICVRSLHNYFIIYMNDVKVYRQLKDWLASMEIEYVEKNSNSSFEIYANYYQVALLRYIFYSHITVTKKEKIDDKRIMMMESFIN